MANEPTGQQRAKTGRKTGALVQIHLNAADQARLKSVSDSLKILPGTAKTVLAHYVFVAGLDALAKAK